LSERQVPFNTGPPAAIKYILALFVLVGGVVGTVWYATRETPKGGDRPPAPNRSAFSQPVVPQKEAPIPPGPGYPRTDP
jgi:hypothetical protein